MATPETKPPLKAVAPGKRIEVPIKKATGPGDDKIHTLPHLVRNEFLISIGIILLLIVWSLLVDAPLEEPANPTRTPNPSKAPWYFLGLQEMLVFFDPWHAGVVLPTFIILGLMVIPYLDINPAGNGYYCWKDRKWEILTFILGFHILWVSLIIIGTFVRGPGWNWFWFWEKWDAHKVEALTNVDLPYLLGVRDETMATIVGASVVLGYFVAGYVGFYVFCRWVKGADFPEFMRRWGWPRFALTGFLFLNMMAVVFKMLGRHLLNLKYIMVLKTPYFSINILPRVHSAGVPARQDATSPRLRPRGHRPLPRRRPRRHVEGALPGAERRRLLLDRPPTGAQSMRLIHLWRPVRCSAASGPALLRRPQTPVAAPSRARTIPRAAPPRGSSASRAGVLPSAAKPRSATWTE